MTPYTEADASAVPLDSGATEIEGRFERILEENRAALGRIAWSYTNTAADREDLLQDIATALWQALPAFRGECAERTFVYRIGHNRAVHFLARRRELGSALEDCGEATDPAPSAERAIEKQQQSERLREAVRRLPLGYRQVVMLALEGLEYAEIGDVLGISETNVGARMTRARTMLRERLQ